LSLRGGAPFKSSNLWIRLPLIYFFHRLLRAAPLSFFLPFLSLSLSLFLFLFFNLWLFEAWEEPFQNFTQLTCIYKGREEWSFKDSNQVPKKKERENKRKGRGKEGDSPWKKIQG
jgi:hypothetical protein